MSWSAKSKGPFDPMRPETLELEVVKQTQPEGIELEFTQQYVAAMAAIAALGEAVGTDGDLYTVNVSGHANLGHQPVDDWAPEFITVTLHVFKDYGQK